MIAETAQFVIQQAGVLVGMMILLEKCTLVIATTVVLSPEKSCRPLSRKVVPPLLTDVHNLLPLSRQRSSGKESNHGETRANYEFCRAS